MPWLPAFLITTSPRESPPGVGVLFKYKSTDLELTHPPPLLLGSHTLDHSPPALITTGACTRQLGTTPMPQHPLKFSNQAILNLLSLPHSFLPRGNHNKGSCHSLPGSLCLLTDNSAFCVALHGMVYPLLLGSVRISYLFNDNWFCYTSNFPLIHYLLNMPIAALTGDLLLKD